MINLFISTQFCTPALNAFFVAEFNDDPDFTREVTHLLDKIFVIADFYLDRIQLTRTWASLRLNHKDISSRVPRSGYLSE